MTSEIRESCSVCLSALPRALRQQVWDFIQADRPELAQVLTGGVKTFPIEKFKEQFGPLKIWVNAADTGLTTQQLQQLPACAKRRAAL